MTPVLWIPKHPETTQMWHFMQTIAKNHQHPMSTYQQLHAWSVEHPALFWAALCDFFNIHFSKPPQHLFKPGDDMMHARWFIGAELNFAELLLKRSDDHPAIISRNEQKERLLLTYNQLREQVAECAAGLKLAGVTKGDRVGAVMPNVAYTLIAMLATASIGAVWSSCSPDFGAQAIVDRFGQIEPKVMFVCDAHVYHGKRYDGRDKIEDLMDKLPTVQKVIVCPNIQTPIPCDPQHRLVMWQDFLIPDQPLTFTPLPFAHPLYILFSSGTTGKPKCIVHGAGSTLLQHVKELGLHTDLGPKDNLCFYTTCGWMMWHWMASGLALGATLTLYEGSPTYPNAQTLFQLIDEEHVTVFGTSAKFIATLEKEGVSPKSDFSLKSLRCILTTGSPLLPQSFDFVYEHIKSSLQLSSISGGTDIISCFALGNPMLPVIRGELQCIGLGMSVDIFDEEGHSIRGARGELVCTKPFPSMPIGFWQDPSDLLYQKAYFERFPGVWTHGDFAEITELGGVIIYGRSDALLNPGGVRIGTAEIYRLMDTIPEVSDSVVIAQNWQNDVRIILFVKLRDGLTLDDALQANIRQIIRNNASPRHVPAKILQVRDIPHTQNGKVMEIAVRQTVQGQPITNFPSMANPGALEDYKDRVELRD
ncbi:MAG: acetoacetate--CoA ligase [Legionellales bacterium]|nr:acetoacetate--CoA ligase [Legionellales bacterium]